MAPNLNSILIFDVGGTHLRAAHFEKGEKKFLSKVSHRGFPSFLDWFKTSPFYDVNPDEVVIAAAGPSHHDHLVMTNLGWSFNRKALETFFKCPVLLLNDLEAAVHLLPGLTSFTSLQGTPKEGLKALIAPGTGLGQAFMTLDDKRWIPFATEGGQVLITPPERLRLGPSKRRLEEFLSGPGLSFIHQTLTGELLSPEEISKNEGGAQSEAIDCFLDLLLEEAQSMALRLLPRGGIFLGGSIIRALSPYLEAKGVQSFTQHPTMGSLLREIPLAILPMKDIVIEGAFFAGIDR